MNTVTKITEDLIKESPYLEEALSMGVINLSALAKKILPQINNQNLKKNSLGAVVMALQRLGVKLKKKHYGKTQILPPKDLLVRSNITEYVFQLSPGFSEVQKKLFSALRGSPETYLVTAIGVNEATIFVSETAETKIDSLFKGEKVLFKLKKQSAIILRFSQNTINSPGVYYSILKALAWDGVALNEIISVGNELSIFFAEAQVPKAFNIIQKLITK